MESGAGDLDPARALALVATSRRQIADRLVTPWWYHPVLGVLVGGLVAAQALPTPGRLLALPVHLLGLALLVASYRRRTGVWISGFHPSAPEGPLWVLVAVLVVLGGAAVALQTTRGVTAAPVVAGVLVVPLVVVVGRRFDASLRASLRAS